MGSAEPGKEGEKGHWKNNDNTIKNYNPGQDFMFSGLGTLFHYYQF